MIPLGSQFGTIFESELSSVEHKGCPRNCLEKWHPPKVKQVTIDKPRGSWRRRLACAFSTTKTTVQTATAATTATVAEIAAPVQFLFEFVIRIRFFLDVVVRFQLKTCSNVCIVAPTTTKS